MTMSQSDVAVVVGDRDGWRCHYCHLPIVDPRVPELSCRWSPGLSCVVTSDGCGCGKHRPGEVCSYSASWVPQGDYRWGQVDHRTPKARGGTDDTWNLVLCCGSCNSQKGSRSYLEYLFEWAWAPWNNHDYYARKARSDSVAALNKRPYFIDRYLKRVNA